MLFLAAVLAKTFRFTGLPALLIILVIIAIPVGIGLAIGRATKRRRS